MASLNKLVVNLTANTGKFNKGLTGAQSRLQRFSATAKKVMGAGLAVGAGVAAVGIAGVVRQMGALDKTAKLAARSGFSAKTIAGMGFAAEQSGSDVASMNKAFDKFSRSMGEATEGTGAASDALGMMGLNIEDLMGMKPDDRLLAVSDAIAGLEDPSLRASAAADLFGRSGVELVNVLGMGSEGIKKFQAEADQLGLGFDAAELAKVEAANDAINRVKRSISGMFGSMAVEFAPAIEAISGGLLTMMAKIRGAFGPVKDFVVIAFRTVQDVITDTATVAAIVAQNIGKIWEGMFQDIPVFAGAAFDWLSENMAAMAENLLNLAKAFPGMLDSIGRNLGEEFAFAVGMSDEKIQFDPLADFRAKKLTKFDMPDFGPALSGVGQDIDDALAVNRKGRALSRATAGVPTDTPAGDALKPGDAPQPGEAANEKAAGKTFAGAMAQGTQDAYSAIINATGNKQTEKMGQIVENGDEANGTLKDILKAIESGGYVSVSSFGPGL